MILPEIQHEKAPIWTPPPVDASVMEDAKLQPHFLRSFLKPEDIIHLSCVNSEKEDCKTRLQVEEMRAPNDLGYIAIIVTIKENTSPAPIKKGKAYWLQNNSVQPHAGFLEDGRMFAESYGHLWPVDANWRGKKEGSRTSLIKNLGVERVDPDTQRSKLMIPRNPRLQK